MLELTNEERSEWAKKKVINLTDIKISEKTEEWLSRGLNFNLESSVNIKHLVYNLESIILRSKLKIEEQFEIRDEWNNVIKKFNKKQAQNNRRVKGLNANFNKLKDELKDITICQADKSKAAVLISKTWEKEKVFKELKKQAYK